MVQNFFVAIDQEEIGSSYSREPWLLWDGRD